MLEGAAQLLVLQIQDADGRGALHHRHRHDAFDLGVDDVGVGGKQAVAAGVVDHDAFTHPPGVLHHAARIVGAVFDGGCVVVKTGIAQCAPNFEFADVVQKQNATVGACGLQGEMERPNPLWGEPPIDGADDPRLKKPEVEEEAPAAEEEDVPDDELLGGLDG